MNVELKKGDGTVETMTDSEFSRWMCLIEAFEFISNKAKELQVDVYSMLKPLAIDVYIKERYDSMYHDVKCELELGIL